MNRLPIATVGRRAVIVSGLALAAARAAPLAFAQA
jgi:hypothetical protein